MLRENHGEHGYCHIAQSHENEHPPRHHMADAECQNGAQDEQSVGDWIEQLADLAHLIEFTRNET
ncbi:hypothetical protein LIP81_21285, partial [Erysipelatoclostridium ramosum]|nr:hypothetical protein [Thomasclavelia ramosa]